MTLGLNRLFTDKPFTREAAPSSDEVIQASPKAEAIAQALFRGDSTEGYAIPKERQRELQVEVVLRAEDYLNDGGACSLEVYYELDLAPNGADLTTALDRTFGPRLRTLRELRIRRRRYLVSNPEPQPISRTSPSRRRTGSSNARMPGATRSAWNPKPSWWMRARSDR